MLDALRSSREALAASFDQSADLVQFPGRQVPGSQAEARVAIRPASNENNVIAFPVARRGATYRR